MSLLSLPKCDWESKFQNFIKGNVTSYTTQIWMKVQISPVSKGNVTSFTTQMWLKVQISPFLKGNVTSFTTQIWLKVQILAILKVMSLLSLPKCDWMSKFPPFKKEMSLPSLPKDITVTNPNFWVTLERTCAAKSAGLVATQLSQVVSV